MNSDQIRAIEELTINAWPAPQTVVDDGWIIRLGGGYTRRANSVTPLYAGIVEVGEKIRFCEALYTRNGLPTVFKLTAACEPPGLEAVLAGSGYVATAATNVQVTELLAANSSPDDRVRDSAFDEWAAALLQFGYVTPKQTPALRVIVGGIMLPHRLALLREKGQVAACGLAVLQGQWLGLYDIVVDPLLRRRGFGKALVQDLLNWGKSNGGSRAYLQVMSENAAARELYRNFGFHEVYGYEYWRRP